MNQEPSLAPSRRVAVEAAGLTVLYFAAAVWIYRRTQWRKE